MEEVIGFFRDHMPDIDAGRFFRELLEDSDVLIPGIIVILSPHLRNEVDYVAYEELQKAVDRAFPTHAQ